MIRRMAAGDVDEVAALEAASFSAPWHASSFLRLLDRPGAELWVSQDQRGRLVAYGVLWCVLDQAELANIAVLPDVRGRGLGGALLDHLVEVARERGVRSIFLEVRESNVAARALYAGRGFQEVGVRKGYYDSPPEDARVLELRLSRKRM